MQNRWASSLEIFIILWQRGVLSLLDILLNLLLPLRVHGHLRRHQRRHRHELQVRVADQLPACVKRNKNAVLQTNPVSVVWTAHLASQRKGFSKL